LGGGGGVGEVVERPMRWALEGAAPGGGWRRWRRGLEEEEVGGGGVV
jgi:hypothetical protein